LSLLAVEDWACPNCLFNLNKREIDAGRSASTNKSIKKTAWWFLKKSYPTGRTTLVPVLRPGGLELPRVEAPSFSRTRAGLGFTLPA